MHRLFTIEYLLHEICSHASRSDLPVLARISSIWFRPAISHLYKDVEIEHALAPLRMSKYHFKFDVKSDLGSTDLPSDEVFERFLKYSPYVRSLDGPIDDSGTIVALLAMRKSVSKGILYLFPNNRSLRWTCPVYKPKDMELSISLLSPGIERLALDIVDGGVLHYLCPLIMTRIPALRSLNIYDETYGALGDKLVKPVQDLLFFFTNTLITVEISYSINSPLTVEYLSKMPNLCNLGIGGDPSVEMEKLERAEGQKDRERFPSLRSFVFGRSFESFRDMFLKPYGLPSLTILSLDGFHPTPADVHIILSSIAVACPRIKRLELGEDSYGNECSTWPVVPWSSVQPIAKSCKELTRLSLNGIRVSVSIKELTKFLKSRTTWTHLHLITSTPMRLQDMVLHAKYCPKLEHLGIYIQLDDSGEFRARDIPVDIPTFSTLTSIDFSGSKIQNSMSYPLAQFLHRICQKPLHNIHGLIGNKLEDFVLKNLASLYIDEQYKTGQSITLTAEVRDFVKMVLEHGMS